MLDTYIYNIQIFLMIWTFSIWNDNFEQACYSLCKTWKKIIFQQAIWNWMDNYPLEFNNLQQKPNSDLQGERTMFFSFVLIIFPLKKLNTWFLGKVNFMLFIYTIYSLLIRADNYWVI